MPSSLDCTLCLMRQSLEAARFASNDTTLHENVVKKVMEMVMDRGFHIPPPIIGQEIHRAIRKMTNNPDPYAKVKREFNDLLLSKMDSLRGMIENSSDRFETALRIAIAGNMIDCALRANIHPGLVDEAVNQALSEPIAGDVGLLKKLIDKSDKILYLLDNCGEIVCDRLFIEQILPKKVIAAVRGTPVLNDATLEDAKYVGLTEIVPVIDNGNDGIGTILEQCSKEFLEHFHDADLILSKGLGNYETLITYGPEMIRQPVMFLFKAKCSFIADFAGVKLGDTVVRLKDDKK